METHLPSLPLMKIFSYLDAYSLLQVAQVNKNWNALASSDVLWRKLCQKRWLFCDMVTLQLQDKETWKQFFVYRTWQEHSKTRANPRDFTYKEIPLQYGPCGYACYISGCGITRKGQDKSVVCMVNSKNTISTWDVHKSVITWVSPEQPASIKLLTTLPEMHIAVTVDIQSTIKLWDCHNREALATNILESPCKSLKAVITKDDPIVLAGDILGNLYIFRIPDLHLISTVNVLPCDIDEIYCSPQKKWVLLSKKQPYILPKVFYMSSLLRTSEFSAPVSTLLEISLCQEAFWTPRREDRLTLMSRSGCSKITKFETYDMKLEEFGNKIIVKGNSIAGFLLPYYTESLNWFGVSDKDTIVCSTEFSLLLFTNNGHRLQTFQYFSETIVRLSVDPVHVIVTCNDGSLDVYAWEERSLLLRKCYRLKNRRHLSPRGFINKTLCDDVSIIQLMIDGHDTWFLMAYALNICS
ncbi:F-box and WD-40 domain protein 27 isoform 1 [Mus musculus]|uniref:F-box and WD-40 domain protein 27 isoform 1 n=1 Tax=Mus musculus TaxID=10090 RepID=UPI0000606240|nr:F-box and WD-40 domain protein 27 isoform 1 [Mus musculus]EDL09039.1 mCG2032, isoform CRA_b [Mus musculus]|eukprot:NP_001289932.1 F-box and WD-40 domain protein 27 isoform 1 [Mus musculus]